jgi:hypothetical protein
MTRRKRSRLLLAMAAMLFGALLLSPFLGKANPEAGWSASELPAPSRYVPQGMQPGATPLPYILYLPLVMRKFPLQTLFGAELDQLTAGGGLDQMAAADILWTRRNAVLWSAVESTEGARNWSALTGLESELQNASSKGMRVILVVRSTPQWARKVGGSGSTCGPVSQGKLAAFASFMGELVARYSVPPYNVRYWELWNEPDVDSSFFPGDNIYGCWGDAADDYYGGGHYANMLKEVYPAIKSADPAAQVLVGGLLLDCDPANTSICKDGREKPARFLEGILRVGGAAYFDGVSFHGYDYYSGTLGSYLNPNWQSAWNTTGPVGIAKAHFLQGVLSAYGVTGKYLMNTETAILCSSCAGDATFEATKAYYLAQSYGSAMAEGWRADIWYSVLGWRNSGLLNSDLSPRPAYEAFHASRSELQDARLLREITEYKGVKGYVFDRGDRQVWLMWSLDGADHAVILPFAPYAALDVFGSSLAASSTMTVTLAPVYVER